MPKKTVTFNRKKLKRLKHLYNQAVSKGKETLTFEGTVLLVSDVKNLIEYLDSYYEN